MIQRKARQQMNDQLVTGQNIIQHEEKTSLRLNKYISDSGHCSRREADRLIEANRVTIDGEPAIIGTRVFPGQKVAVDGKLVSVNTEKVYIALNKPRGITSTTDQDVEGNLTDFMDYPEIIFPIGRLDKDSTGLLLLTNDGDIVNKILREENGHDKEYEVKVDAPYDDYFVESMTNGVEIYNLVANKRQMTSPAKVEEIDDRTFYLTLNQGLNRQIRRMCQELSFKVVKLKRTRVMNIYLDDLAEGEWRYLTAEELLELNAAINKNN